MWFRKCTYLFHFVRLTYKQNNMFTNYINTCIYFYFRVLHSLWMHDDQSSPSSIHIDDVGFPLSWHSVHIPSGTTYYYLQGIWRSTTMSSSKDRRKRVPRTSRRTGYSLVLRKYSPWLHRHLRALLPVLTQVRVGSIPIQTLPTGHEGAMLRSQSPNTQLGSDRSWLLLVGSWNSA